MKPKGQIRIGSMVTLRMIIKFIINDGYCITFNLIDNRKLQSIKLFPLDEISYK